MRLPWTQCKPKLAGSRSSVLAVESLEAREMLHGGDVAEVQLVAEGEGELVPDFSLLDVNATSSRFNQSISPRDYLGQVSGWYFGHAT